MFRGDKKISKAISFSETLARFIVRIHCGFSGKLISLLYLITKVTWKGKAETYSLNGCGWFLSRNRSKSHLACLWRRKEHCSTHPRHMHDVATEKSIAKLSSCHHHCKYCLKQSGLQRCLLCSFTLSSGYENGVLRTTSYLSLLH